MQNGNRTELIVSQGELITLRIQRTKLQLNGFLLKSFT